MAQAAQIFVSHSSENSAWCHKFVAGLRSAGADPWYDEHNLGYGALMDVIEREIRARPIFIVVLSPHAVASRWVQREMQAAMILQDEQPERIIMPVVAEKCDIPVFWRTYKYLSGPGNAGLGATEAAGRVAHTLALVPVNAPTSPEPQDEPAEEARTRGRGLLLQGRLKEALEAYERAISLDPTDAIAWNGKGNVLWDMKHYADALSAYDRAVQANPNWAYGWGNKGIALRELERREEALDAFDHALTLIPRLKYVWSNKIETLEELGRKAEADEARRQRDAALKEA